MRKGSIRSVIEALKLASSGNLLTAIQYRPKHKCKNKASKPSGAARIKRAAKKRNNIRKFGRR